MSTYLSTDAGALIDGRYRLSALIAQGPHAEVWQARDERLARFVALRRFRPGATDAGHEHAQIPLLARLNHPGLLPVLDAGVEHDAGLEFDAGLELETGVGRRAFLITDFMTTPTLAVELANRRVAAHEIARIGTQVAAALAYAHSCGVPHGRISAANIFMTPTQSAPAKLADLGIAALLTGDAAASTDAAAAADVRDLAGVLLAAHDVGAQRATAADEQQRRMLAEAARASLAALEFSARLSAFTVPSRPTEPVAQTGRWLATRFSSLRVSKAAAA